MAVNSCLVSRGLFAVTRAYQLVAVNSCLSTHGCQLSTQAVLNSELVNSHLVLLISWVSTRESCLSTHQLSTCACQLVVLYYQLSTLNSSTIGYHFVLINSSTVNLSMSACGSLLSARQLSTRQLMGRVNLRFCGRTVRVTCTNTYDLFKAGR